MGVAFVWQRQKQAGDVNVRVYIRIPIFSLLIFSHVSTLFFCFHVLGVQRAEATSAFEARAVNNFDHMGIFNGCRNLPICQLNISINPSRLISPFPLRRPSL